MEKRHSNLHKVYLNFKGNKETAEQIFGRKQLRATDLWGKLWGYMLNNVVLRLPHLTVLVKDSNPYS